MKTSSKDRISIKKSIRITFKIFHLKLLFLVCLLSLGIMFFESCEKETDTKHPLVIIHSPAELQNFSVFDNIPVNAKITDDKVITTIKVVLTDDQFISALPAVYLYPNVASYDLEMDYPINDKYIETGEYYLLIRAEDGPNFKNKYQKIFIAGIPRELEQIIVLTEKSTTEVGVSGIDKFNQINYLFDINGDYAASEIDSRYRQLYIAGINVINIQCYNLETHDMEWQQEIVPPLPLHPENCLYFDENLYASFTHYYINGYRWDGSSIFNTTVEENKLPSKIARFNDLLLADLQSKTGGNTHIATYYTVSGSEKQRLLTHYQVVEFLPLDNNNVLVVANEFDQGLLKVYNPYQNVETPIMEISGKINCAVKLSNNNYLIGTEDEIYVYNDEQSVITEVLPGVIAFRLKFDELNSNIYTVGAHLINKIKYPQMTHQTSHVLPDSIFDVHLLYNK